MNKKNIDINESELTRNKYMRLSNFIYNILTDREVCKLYYMLNQSDKNWQEYLYNKNLYKFIQEEFMTKPELEQLLKHYHTRDQQLIEYFKNYNRAIRTFWHKCENQYDLITKHIYKMEDELYEMYIGGNTSREYNQRTEQKGLERLMRFC